MSSNNDPCFQRGGALLRRERGARVCDGAREDHLVAVGVVGEVSREGEVGVQLGRATGGDVEAQQRGAAVVQVVDEHLVAAQGSGEVGELAAARPRGAGGAGGGVDDVEAEFAAEKAAAVASELPAVEEPSALPGWGAWVGQQRNPKWMQAAKEKAAK